MPETTRQAGADSLEFIAALLRSARAGSEPALGALLASCREYLLLVANQELRADLQPKFGASDVVQETFLDAQRDFARFNGQTRADLLVWLRTILLNNLRDTERSYRAARRDVAREVPLGHAGDPGLAPHAAAASVETPSWLAQLRERDEGIWRALAAVRPDYRDVIVARSLELKSFVEIGRQSGRSPDAVRKLWARAIEAVQDVLEGRDDD